MDQSVSRRTVLGGTAVGVGVALSGSLEAFARPQPGVRPRDSGYGPLIPDPASVIALPEGFTYKVLARSGQPIQGRPHPSDPDGMGVFARPTGGSILVSNHEYGASEAYRVVAAPELTYDTGSFGGTSTIEVDAGGEPVSVYTSLAGTENNCAGGITPWGTWLTCEETERRKGTPVGTGTMRRVLLKDHGYVFEVHPTNLDSNRNPVPLKFLGRYSHEAVAVDPRTHDIYLTEDAVNPNGLYYRWQPPRGFNGRVGALRELADSPGGDTAGRLQAMSCYRGRRQIVDLSEATEVGTRYKVRWVDVPDRLAISPTDPPTRSQDYVDDDGNSIPVTRSRKLEGAWWGNGGAYFVASFARPLEVGDGSLNAHDGQVWFYDPSQRTVTLKTLFGPNKQPDSEGTFDGPDNITVSPHGGLIVAEDGQGIQHLIGVTSHGHPYAFARNQTGDGEFCGPSFSTDGKTLFVNIQAPGLTLAITGPWHRT